MKKIIALMLALLLCFSLAACNSAPAAPSSAPPTSSALAPPSSSAPPTTAPQPDLTQPPPPPVVEQAEVVVDTVQYSSRNNFWDVGPWKGNGNTGTTMWFYLYSCLMANPGYGTTVENMQYDMAESVSFSADKMTATVKLRDYIHDSKGNPIKAEDVVFSYERAPVVSAVYAKMGTLLGSITAIDEYTIEMTLTKQSPGAWEILLAFCPIVNKAWYESSSDDEKSNDPATTGAYYVSENVSGSIAVFTAVEDFWQKDELRSLYQIVNAKNIVFNGIPEDTMRVIAMETGELDIGYIENSSVGAFLDNPDYNVFGTSQANPTTWVFNCAEGRPFYDNPALRKAVLHAIDFEASAIASSEGWGRQGHDIAGIICSDYDPAWDDEPYYDYNLDTARQYLAEAGYNENSGLTIHFMIRNITHQIRTIEVLQSNLLDLGIDVVIDAYDQALFDTYSADPNEWDIRWDTTNMMTGLVSESWEYYYGSRGEQGSTGFVKDAKLQQLLDEAMLKNDKASNNAFRDYAVDMAYAVNQNNEPIYIVGRKEVLTLPFSFIATPTMNACTFSSDY